MLNVNDAELFERLTADTPLTLKDGTVIQVPPHPQFGFLGDDQLDAYEELVFEAKSYDREDDVVDQYEVKRPDGKLITPAKSVKGPLKVPHQKDGKVIRPTETVRWPRPLWVRTPTTSSRPPAIAPPTCGRSGTSSSRSTAPTWPPSKRPDPGNVSVPSVRVVNVNNERRSAMIDDEYTWGHAEVSYPDWHGTAQLDHKLTGQEDIYDWTGIDREEFVIIGLDFGAGETGAFNPHVIAVRRDELGETKLYEQSEIRAVDIQVHDVDPFELLLKMTHILDMRFRTRGVKDANITITDRLDSPPQDDDD
jgi:hypothetical protein